MQNKIDCRDDEGYAFNVTVNTTAFGYKESPLKERTQVKYLPKYWKKMRMDQKNISPSCEDRLSELTTRQIDRIIDMEKIRSILNDRKAKIPQLHFQFNQQDPKNKNIHTNVYQANFLAKINQIAIKRNIRHEKSEAFDDYFGEEIVDLHKQKNKDQKHSKIAYKYSKKYQADERKLDKNRRKTEHLEEDVKSLPSIEDQIEKFEEKIENKNSRPFHSLTQQSKEERDDYKFVSSNRWLHGMSTFHIDRNNPKKPPVELKIQKFGVLDIESQVDFLKRYSKNHQNQSHRLQKTNNFSTESSNLQERKRNIKYAFVNPMQQYRKIRLAPFL